MMNNRKGKVISLKSLLPYENYVIESKLSVDQLRARLLNAIEPKPTTLSEAVNRYHEKPYEGSFSVNEFKVNRIISSSNPFLPTVSGYIVNKIDGTIIYIQVRINKYKMIVWYLFVMIFFIVITSAPAFFDAGGTNKNTFLGKDFGLGVLFVSGITIPLIILKIESRKAKKFLAKVFGVVK